MDNKIVIDVSSMRQLNKDTTKRLICVVISIFVLIYDIILNKVYKIIDFYPQKKILVLYYHSVTKNQRNNFATQMNELIKYAQPISANFKFLPSSKKNTFVAVTFDDGFLNVFENALPELLQRKIPFTVFITTGYMGKYPDWIKGNQKKIQERKIISINELKKSVEECKFMEIGSHTVTHAFLNSLSDKDIRKELLESKKILEKIYKKKIDMLSFPYGRYDQKTINICRETGFNRVFSIIPTINNYKNNWYVFGRVHVDPTNWKLEYRLKLLGAYRWMPKTFTLKKKVKKLFKV